MRPTARDALAAIDAWCRDSLWSRMFAAPKLRRVGMPTDRVLAGYYLFRYDLLLGWCPATQPAGRFFAELAGLD